MSRIFLSLLLFISLLAAPAAAEDNYTSLDEVDDGHTEALDEVDTGETESLDEVDDGRTERLGTVDTGHTETLDSVDTGRMESLEEVDTGRTYGLDEAHGGTIVDRPKPAPKASFPGPLSDDWKTQLRVAYDQVVKAGRRYEQADHDYIVMRRTRFPTGDARVEVEREYAEAQYALKSANTRYTGLVEQAKKSQF